MKLKNLSSVILAAMMAATSVPAASLIAPYSNLSAYAVETAEPEEEAPIAEGMCGENLTWEIFAGENALVIDGTGAMTEWEKAEDAPWAEYGDSISLVVIRENVGSVSGNAFGATRGRIFYFDSYDCVIPDSETFLPENALIHGYDNSTAQAYAEKYCRVFSSEGEYKAPTDENIPTDENVPTDENIPADENVPTDKEDSTVIEGDRIVAEGICGENLKWEIDSSEDILIISGYGEMTDWEKPEDAPWFEYSNEFDMVIIRPGVGELSEYSIGDNVKIIYLTSYNCVIPDSETAIPADAAILGYAGSTAQAYAEKYGREFSILSEGNDEYPLMEGVCTENLEWILWNNGTLAFYGFGDIVAENGVYPWDVVADSIKEVVINTAVRSIGENAFTNCTNLESVLMYTPDCKIADSADVFPSDVLFQVGEGSTAEEYADKYDLNYDVYNFFTAKGEIGDNLTWVLFNGGSLRIYGEGDMIDLGGANPWGEYEDEITRVQIDEEVTSIDKAAFEGCDNIAEMIVLNPDCKFAESEETVPEDTVIYAAEGSGALMYAQLFGRSFKTLSSEITTPEEEESYIAYGELGENLTWKLLNDGMLEIDGEGEMLECGEGGYPWSEFSDKIKDISLAKEVTSVGAYAFYNCKNLETLHLAPVIGEHAYDGCSNVTLLGFYEDLTINEIGDYAFNGCDNLGGLTIENPDCVIADSEFVFPANITINGYNGSTAQAYAEKYGLEFVEITSGEQEIVAEGMCGENVSWAIYEDEKSLIISGEGEMANWETTDAAPWAEYSDFIEAVCINDGVKSIGENSFDALSNIWQFISYSMDCVIPDSDTAIPENAEILCYNGSTAQAYAEKYGRTCVFMGEIDNDIIVSGELGENLSWNIQTDGYLNVFGNGDMIEIDGVYPWDEYAEQITEVLVSGNVTSISAGAFDDCENIKAVWIHNRDCVIADVDNVFPANIQITCYENSKVHEYAEKYGYNCTFWYESDASGTIGNNLYWDLKEGHLNIYGNGDMIEIDGVYPWDEYAEQITYVTIQNDVTSISAGAFDDCENVEAVLIHNNDCVIADVDNVFPANITINGYNGSTAQAYAEKYGLDFMIIEEEPVTTTAPDSDSETTTTTTTTTPNDSESELPQTGFSKAYDYLAFSAGVMALCGIYAMKKSKKKEDEE